MPIKKNVLQTVLDILGSAPDVAIKSDSWIEIFKTQLALKGLASAIDSLREKANTVTVGQEVVYQSLGDLSYALYLQDLTKVQVIAGQFIRYNSSVYFLPDGAGGIKAYPTKFAIKAEAFSPSSVAAGAMGTFVLKGLISYNYDFTGTFYSMNGINNSSANAYQGHASHHRMSTYPDGFGDAKAPIGSMAWYTAYDFWTKETPKQKGPHYKYTGVAIGNAAATVYGLTYLGYFNPERD